MDNPSNPQAVMISTPYNLGDRNRIKGSENESLTATLDYEELLHHLPPWPYAIT